MEKKQKLIILLITLSLVLVCTGLSFAFFTSISNNESASTIYAKGGTMNIVYANGSGNIVMENIYPREEAWVNKEFTVTGNNSTELDMEYRIYLKTSSNGFNAGDLTYSISGTSTNSGDKLVEKANQPLAKTGELLLGKGIFKSKTATHSYNLRIFYKEKNADQNNGQGKSFTGYVHIDNGSSLAYDTLVTQTNSSSDSPAFNGPITRSEVKTITLTSSSKVPANAIASWDAGEKQDGTIMAYLLNKDENGLYDLYIGQDGKVVLGKNASGLFSGYNKTTTLDVSNINTSNVTNMRYMFQSTSATSIKGLDNFDTSNVTNMSEMFQNSQATTLDLSSFDTSNVTNMSYMFSSSKATTLDLSSFDTSKVTDMYHMFYGNQATTLDLSSFNTSKVTNMSKMFYNSKATTLDLSSFNTSNVTDMSDMFTSSKATTLDLSSFNTSNVTDMSNMFYGSQATTLDLSSFDTSKVINMYHMFTGSKATTLDLSNFDTSNVTNMLWMFCDNQATTLDLSSFNTSNVTDMSKMFYNSKATTLDLSSFNTSNVTNMHDMFCYSQATTLNLSSFDTSKVTDMSNMFSRSKVTALDLSSFDMTNVKDVNNMFGNVKATTAYARTQADADKLNSSSNKPSKLNFTVKP